jgi:hypothetical protein
MVRESENDPLRNSMLNRCISNLLHDADEVLHEKLQTVSLSRLMSQQISPINISL